MAANQDRFTRHFHSFIRRGVVEQVEDWPIEIMNASNERRKSFGSVGQWQRTSAPKNTLKIPGTKTLAHAS